MKHRTRSTRHENINAYKQKGNRINRIPGSSTSRRSASNRTLFQLSRYYPIRHEGLKITLILAAIRPKRTGRSGTHQPTKGHAIPNDDNDYLLKFAPPEAYIDDLMGGCLYMNAVKFPNMPTLPITRLGQQNKPPGGIIERPHGVISVFILADAPNKRRGQELEHFPNLTDR